MPWHRRREKFDDLDLELWSARNKVQEMQSKADDARKEPDLSSMTPAEWNAAIDAHEAGVLNADREARDASEKHAAKCREFRNWCTQQRDNIPTERDDPARVFNHAERAEGQTFHELRKVLQAQLESIEVLKEQGTICPHAFHRPDGSPIKDFRETWKKACEAAGYPGKLFHDFRRSAVRTLERSGVPRSTAMAMVGHKTESIYRRYAIVDEQMHQEAAAKLDVWATEQQGKAEAARKGQVKRFKKRQAS